MPELSDSELAEVRHWLDQFRLASGVPVLAENVRRLRLEPGDTVVVKLDYLPSKDMMRGIHETLKTAFPGHVVMVLPPGHYLSVASPDATTTHYGEPSDGWAHVLNAVPGLPPEGCGADAERRIAAAIGIPAELIEATGIGANYAGSEAALDAFAGKPEPVEYTDRYGAEPLYAAPGTFTNTGAATWDGQPVDILANIQRIKAEMDAAKALDRWPDVLVMLRSDADAVWAQYAATFGRAGDNLNAIGGVRVEVAETVIEGRALALEFGRRGNRVGLVGALNVAQESAPVADAPVEVPARE
jgi:hypothetical protein